MATKNLSDILKISLNNDLLKQIYPLVTKKKTSEAKIDINNILDVVGKNIDISKFTSSDVVIKTLKPLIEKASEKLPWLKFVVSSIETKGIKNVDSIDLTKFLGKTSKNNDVDKILSSLGVDTSKIDIATAISHGSKLIGSLLKK